MYVIGSGPSGVSCAKALLDQGATVTMLDAGRTLEPVYKSKLEQLKSTSHRDWDDDSLAFLKQGMAAETSGIPLKLSYGSNFPYDLGMFPDAAVGVLPSLAQGGLSNVWGAAILPCRPDDIRHWPISIDDIAEHYRAVLRFMPLAGRRDDLSRVLPLYTEDPLELALSRQSVTFLDDLQKNRERLAEAGISFGQSRLAVSTKNENGQTCVYCGNCLYGCPYGLPYNSASTLEKLTQHPRFRYSPGVFVDSLSENANGVVINAHDLSGTSMTLRSERAFLAAGVLSSTRLLLMAQERFDSPVMLKDSQYFLLPLMRYHSTANTAKEELHTLSQAFIEILDRTLSERSIHLQIYSYNDLYWLALKKMFGPAFPLLSWPLDYLVGRLLMIQGYLPSEHSSAVQMQVNNRQGKVQTEVAPIINRNTRVMLGRVAEKLNQNRGALRAIAIKPFLRMGDPGRGYHVGGSFPMSANPGPHDSDILGRPTGFKRLHVVDATVLPDIPSTTITLTVMANAHRIGTMAAQS